jgi:hypothetical protein
MVFNANFNNISRMFSALLGSDANIFIFIDNVDILCISCNGKKSKISINCQKRAELDLVLIIFHDFLCPHSYCFFTWIEIIIRGHLSYKTTFTLTQMWPLNTSLTAQWKLSKSNLLVTNLKGQLINTSSTCI